MNLLPSNSSAFDDISNSSQLYFFSISTILLLTNSCKTFSSDINSFDTLSSDIRRAANKVFNKFTAFRNYCSYLAFFCIDNFVFQYRKLLKHSKR